MWYDHYYDDDGDYWDDDNDSDNKFLEWYDGYKKRKAQQAKIKEELFSITWHPSRYWDWCMSEDETKKQKNYWHFLCLMMTRHKIFLTQKRIENKDEP